jgi:hypothetical protein
MIAGMMRADGLHVQGHDDFAIKTGEVSLERASSILGSAEPFSATMDIDPRMSRDLKFSFCLPSDLALATLARRLEDRKGFSSIYSRHLRVIRDVTGGF